jgi:excinuclease ABC subunit A
MENISIRGAKTHNLKSVDLDLPRDKLIVVTGLSGSGKSSLAFDTLYAEGQRRYVESLSAYARQFLSMMEKPDVEHIEGLSPAISIEQKSTSHNPRSTVGTITEIHDYLRLLYARVGEPRCPEHNEPLTAQTIGQMVDQVLALPEDSKLMLLAPIIRGRKGEHAHIFQNLRAQGFIRVRIDGLVVDLDDVPELEKNKQHDIEGVVDRLKVKDDLQLRLSESFETALNLSEGLAIITAMKGPSTETSNTAAETSVPDMLFSARFACPICNYSIDELEPRMFSFNNPAGACPGCDGLGVKQFFDIDRVVQYPECSISEGAIRSWDRKNLFYFNMLTSLADHYNFNIDHPFQDLAPQHQQVVLFGSGNEVIDFNYVNDKGTVFKRSHQFEGIIPNMERRYRETESQSVREDLTKYMNTQHCPECDGGRLRKSARHVIIDEKTLPELGNITV